MQQHQAHLACDSKAGEDLKLALYPEAQRVPDVQEPELKKRPCQAMTAMPAHVHLLHCLTWPKHDPTTGACGSCTSHSEVQESASVWLTSCSCQQQPLLMSGSLAVWQLSHASVHL